MIGSSLKRAKYPRLTQIGARLAQSAFDLKSPNA